MKRNILLIALAALLTLLTSCRDEAPEIYDPNDLDYLTLTQQFDRVWQGINNYYSWWEVDTTDWDAARAKYRPQIELLDRDDFVSTDELERIYTEMCGSLRDHHMAIFIQNIRHADSDRASFWVSPGGDEAASRPYYHVQQDERLFSDAFAESFHKTGRTSNVKETFANTSRDAEHYLSCLIDNDILYLRLSIFFITYRFSKLTDSFNRQVKEVVDNYINLAQNHANLKGVIVDVRNNGGGYNNDQNYVMGPLIDDKFLIGYFRSKTGTGRYDFGPWTPYSLYPYSKERLAPKCPVVVLADVRSISNAEITAQIAKQMPNGIVVGERTYGATGSLVDDVDLYYNGSFGSTSGDHYVKTTTWMYKTANDEIVEGIGITPDISCPFDAESLKSGIDNQLNAAIDYIKR